MKMNNPRLFFVAFLIMILIAFGILLTVATSNEIMRIKKYTADPKLPLLGMGASLSFYKMTMHYKEIGESLLADNYISDWILGGEHDPENVIEFMKSVRDENELLDASLVSDLSETYYGTDGRQLKLSPENIERDGWYYHYREYSDDVNIDSWVYPDTGIIGLYVNIPVKDNSGRYIGVTGGGIDSSVFDRMLKDFELQWAVRLYLVRDDGQFIYATDHELLSSGIDYIDDLWDSQILEQITRRRHDADGVVIFPKSGDVILWGGYMPEWNSYLIIEHGNSINSILGSSVRHPVLLEIVIACFLFSLVAVIMKHLYTRAMTVFQNGREQTRYTESLLYFQEILLQKSLSYVSREVADISGERPPQVLGIQQAQISLKTLEASGDAKGVSDDFDLNEIINGYLLDNTPAMEKRGIRLISRLRSTPLMISGDEPVTCLIIEDVFNSINRIAEKGSEIVFISGKSSDIVFVNASFRCTELPGEIPDFDVIKPILIALNISISVRDAGEGRFILKINFYSSTGE